MLPVQTEKHFLSRDHLQNAARHEPWRTTTQAVRQLLGAVRIFARQHDLRLSFHPDQFVVLSSPHPVVVASSIRELEYQAFLADEVGADVINIHAGGVYGDKKMALERFYQVITNLPEAVRIRLTLENDDQSDTAGGGCVDE